MRICSGFMHTGARGRFGSSVAVAGDVSWVDSVAGDVNWVDSIDPEGWWS